MFSKSAFIALIATLSLVATATAHVLPYELYNPYMPRNAIAAEPRSPYNLWDDWPISRTAYGPIPDWRPIPHQFLDIPPIYCPIYGPFQIPVPVP